ncbi:30S ribosomal protein S5 [Candidatus Peregrinibacteria bacterium CG_4_10_14_0_2_um_filter_38_24]|nr:MAG: 30S ribosomal protein S5 [Candidatus Peregrinibacteria bacterium CG_4_10_14_0_2_um_filter_38_24]PJC38626.1 MAG: 30S ribosomal protein S5 [Candidatus Peregrinibacteria bacterium CG_4_9_14_0_2_um_filter_38_9]
MTKRPHSKGEIRKEPKEYDEQVIEISRVVKVVKGGRRLRFRATVVIGNRKGKVGVGIGKSNEVTGAIQKAITQAKKNTLQVLLDQGTIPHDVEIRQKSSHIKFMRAKPGTGIIAGNTIRKLLELSGLKDIYAKSFGTTNKINNTKATFSALKLLRTTPGMDSRARNTSAKQTQPKPNQQINPVKNAIKPVATTQKPAVSPEQPKPDNK